MRLLRLRYLILILSVVLILGGTVTASVVQGGLGTVAATEVDFHAADGSNIHATLQKPVYATASAPLPGVVVIHGVIQSKEWLMAFGIEIARRGFVVLTIDANGHGDSDAGTGSGAAALTYLAALSYVNSSALGIIGHSMGGGIAWSAIQTSGITVNAFVIVGSGVSTANATYPRNLLVEVGQFDSLSSYPRNLTLLNTAFGVTNVQPGITYGDFNAGTARKIVIARTNHLFETIDPVIISESVEWMKDSLKGGAEDSHWLPKADLIYTYWLFGGFVGLLGAMLSIFPILAILIDIPSFAVLKRQPSSEHASSNRSYLGSGLIYGAIGLGTFFPLLAIGSFLELVLPSPGHYGLAISTWILGAALVALLVLYLLLRHNKSGLTLKALASIDGGNESAVRRFMRTLLVALGVIAWLYAWTALVDLGLALDLRCFLPGLNLLTSSRVLIFPLFSAVFFIYSLIDGMWLMGILRTGSGGSWKLTQAKWTFKAMFIKCILYFAVIATEYGVGLATGMPILGGILGFSLLFFYAFVPWFAMSTVITAWGYRLTSHYYLGAMLNALLFGWILAAALPL
jgi:pimeloyl-ACP methyl ester carboxylesterase